MATDLRRRNKAAPPDDGLDASTPPASPAAATAASNKGEAKPGLKEKLVADAAARDASSQWIWNVGLAVVTILSIISRTYLIHHPTQVVFDEVHFGKFASYYLRHEYYFDVHPPLGKLMLAAMGWFLGYDGHFLFENIADDYITNEVPYIGLRLMPAICGSLVIPLGYLILKEIGVSIYGALFGAALLILDTALINQSRLILLDSMLMVFGVWAIYNWIRFYKERKNPFTFNWWFWMAMTGVALACTLGVKMVGLFTIGTVGIGVLVDLWRLLDWERKVSNREFIRHFAARALCLIFLPLFIYMSFFYIHFEILYLSGPGDAFMSPAFQAGLRGSDVASNSVSVPFGAEITLKHRVTKSYLHSHVDKYPLRYDDGRISSQGQQVTGYPHKDPNNLWELVPVDPELFSPEPEYEYTTEEIERGNIRYLRHDNYVRLRHINTDTFLRTHDVASPLTTTNMEITTLPANAEDMEEFYADTVWRMELTDYEPNMKIRTMRNHFRLISAPHKVAVHVNEKGGPLPDWGFGQKEVNGNKNQLESTNVWYIEDVSHERIVNGTEIDEKPSEQKVETGYPFIAKFLELQNLMITHNAGLTKPHPYSSTPITWPFVLRGISFWEEKEGLKQIYLIGNPLVWWTSIAGVFMYAVMWVMDRIMLRRGLDNLDVPRRRWFDRAIGFLFIAWLLHWLPFFLMGRMLFLHHYLPSFIFSVLVTSGYLDFLGRIAQMDPLAIAGGDSRLAETMGYPAWMRKGISFIYVGVLVVLLGAYVWSFIFFSPLCYGTGFSSLEELRSRKWFDGWDLQHA